MNGITAELYNLANGCAASSDGVAVKICRDAIAEIDQLKGIVKHALEVLQLDFGYSPENPCRYGHHPLRHQLLWNQAIEVLGEIPDVEKQRVAETE